MWVQIILFLVGLALVVFGADYLVEGASAVARKFGLSEFVIGLTIVGMGTSAPEMVVSFIGAAQGNADIALGNVVGSNIFNLMVVCGVTAIITPLFIKKESLRREFPFSILCAAVLMVFGLIGGEVNRIEGIVLLLMFGGFLAYTVISTKKARNAFAAEKADDKIMPMWQCLLFIVCGGTAIAFGGRMVVNSASEIARPFGLSDNVIGLTIVALGTSLPELFTSIVAAKHGEVDIALGNVIGSNIFNILFVLGIATTISPISFMMTNTIDCIALIAMSLIVMIFCWTKQTLQRWEGAVMAAAYTAYIVYITLR